MVIDKSYTDIERMQYLKTSITGEAAKLISTMEVTGDNFTKAWTILVNRYENKRAIRDAHVGALLDLPSITKELPVELRKAYDKSKECVELLSSVSKEQIVLYILMSKLPQETRRSYELSLTNPTEDQSLSEFFEFLDKRCQMLEATEDTTNTQRNLEKHWTEKNVHAAMILIMLFSCVINSKNCQWPKGGKL